MKLSLRWLAELVDLSGIDAEQVRETLTFHAADVEALERPGEALDGVRVARVLSLRPHPSGERLSVCQLECGTGERVQVVCGAANVKAGMHAAWAGPGSRLAAGLEVKAREVRGVASAGMLCSAAELGLGDDAQGLLELTGEPTPGTELLDALALRDTLLDIANATITHRPDLWGHLGFARELATLLRRELRPPALATLPHQAAGATVPVRILDEEGCRRYVGLAFEGVHNGHTPLWMRWRLQTLGLRSLGLLVDLTNFVLLELGQPLHAFDLDRVRGPEIRVRRASAGERLKTLDDVERTLRADDLVIADAAQPLALAGVMGGLESEVGTDTRRILLEAATFDPVRIRRTAQHHALRTEASTRFEKALDPVLAETAARRFAHLLGEHAPGARQIGLAADVYPGPYPTQVIAFDLSLVRRRLGLRVPELRARSVLTSLGFELQESGRLLQVRVPSWRATKDVRLPEDLVEEVGRVIGYRDIQPIAPVGSLAPQATRPQRRLLRAAAAVALDLGYTEVKNYSFYGPRAAQALGLADHEHVHVRNPLSEEQDRLILTTAAQLLRVAAGNQVRVPRARLWEHARLFVPGGGARPTETEVLAACAYDVERGEDLQGTLFLGVVADVRQWLRRMGIRDVSVRQGACDALAPGLPAPVWLHPGRQAVFEREGACLAVVGEVAPGVLRAFEIQGRAVTAEANLDALLEAGTADRSDYTPLQRYPVVPFDVSVIVPRRTPAQQVRSAMQQAASPHVREVEVFDVYEGDGIPGGQRSLALRCELFDEARTLSSEAADTLREKILAALTARGWVVRKA